MLRKNIPHFSLPHGIGIHISSLLQNEERRLARGAAASEGIEIQLLCRVTTVRVLVSMTRKGEGTPNG